MRIVILGAGQVGATLAEQLSGEANDITVVDADLDRLRLLQDRLDIRTVEGQASYPSVLAQAGCADADMLVAVTQSDEVNMMACQLARSLFNVPRKVARIRSSQYLSCADRLFADGAIPVDMLISPERLVTEHIEQLTRWPGALQVSDFVGGRVKLAVYRVTERSAIAGRRLDELDALLPGTEVQLAALYRGDRALALAGDLVFVPGDEVCLIAAPLHLEAVAQLFVSVRRRYRQVMIAGGGNIGAALAARLEARCRVKVIETRVERCREIASRFNETVVIQGNVSELDMLRAEGIDRVDLFCALTNDDEANVMSSLLAKRTGARKALSIINNPAYVDLVAGGMIDYAISPEQITIGCLLAHIRKGDITRVHSLRQGEAEALETVVHGTRQTSRIVGRCIRELRLPPDVSIGAIVRGERVIITHDATCVESEDHLIFFMTSKQSLRSVEKLLQVGLGYF